jgi:hypothetical protein
MEIVTIAFPLEMGNENVKSRPTAVEVKTTA